MLDFQQKRKVRSFIYNRGTLVLLGILTLIVLRSTWIVFEKKIESEEMGNISLTHAKELRSREIALKSKIERLNTSSGIEEEIRSKFSVVKDGEKMVVVVEPDGSGLSTTTQNSGFWRRIWDFFKN